MTNGVRGLIPDKLMSVSVTAVTIRVSLPFITCFIEGVFSFANDNGVVPIEL